MLNRRRQGDSISSPSSLTNRGAGNSFNNSPRPSSSSGRAGTTGKWINGIIDKTFGTSSNGDSKPTSPLRRIFYIVSTLILFIFLLHALGPDSNTTSSYGRGRSLPGFGSRTQFAASRRTDALLRSAKRERALSHGGVVGRIANFSEAAPFSFCPSYGLSDELGTVYGQEALLKTRAHVGSSERVKKVIKRALAGLPITIGVLGGSVSSCHGLDATMAHPLGNPIGTNCYPHRIFSWLNDVFPHPANELTNGARTYLCPYCYFMTVDTLSVQR